MPDFFYRGLCDFNFWLVMLSDAMILLSLNFTFIYAVFLLLGTFGPFRARLRPGPVALPLLLFASAAAIFTPLGEMGAVALNRVFGGLVIDLRLDPANRFQIQLNIITGVWALGFAAQTAFFAMRRRDLARYLKSLSKAAPDPAFTAAKKRLGRLAALRELGPGAGPSPFSFGLLRPVIAIPAGFARDFTYKERYAIYLHELAHIKNRDSLKYLAIGLVRAFLWPSPLLPAALGRYKNGLEIACDRFVISQKTISPLSYSRLVLRAALGEAVTTPQAPGFSAAYGDISRRLGHIFRDGAIIPVGRDRLRAALAIAFMALGLAVLNPAFSVFPKAPEYPAKQISAPDGEIIFIRTSFQWQGALGGYTLASAAAP